MRLFKRDKGADADGYYEVADSAAVVEGEMTVAKAGGRKLILTRWAGVLYAVDYACPHAAADLSDGSLHRWKLCCHEHDYCFDIRSGRIVWPEDEMYRLKRYEVREVDGMVRVKL